MARLTATYRLQMNAKFTFADALARVPYFERLGVSHLYLSPILMARAGSVHGYDVVDPSRINPELGSENDLIALSTALASRNMGIILDIVPNHMGVGTQNWRWEDVLTHGQSSRYAKWFDVDWSPRGPGKGKLVLPVLGDELERVLERGELSVAVGEGERPRVRYFQQSFPLDPATLPPELQLTTFDAEETGELANLFSGVEGKDRLRELLGAQHYRLAYWRRGIDEINYRRFFDVTDLVAVRAEDHDVFRESHALILRLVRDGVIDGLRVDHIDGLRDPLEYLTRLRGEVGEIPMFVEKILSTDEELRREWPIQGTTGYEFLNELEDVFLDPRGATAIEAAYRRSRRLSPDATFRSLASAGKTDVLARGLHSDLLRLVRTLASIARQSNQTWSNAQLESALVAFIAALPAYRTYIDARSDVAAADRDLVERARRDAVAASAASREQIEFIVNVLLDRVAGVGSADRIEFATRLQRLTGPATAKGIEDTALYVYVPLVSRNEVGGAPDHSLDDAVARFHDSNRARAEHWPLTLNATNTHDTKRSADVRARLDALSEVPGEWERSYRRWRRLNARHRSTVKGRLSPDTNTEYLIYQTLVALWPPPRAGRRIDDLPDKAWRDSVRARLARYALKAAREAKTRTSWTEPSPEYEKSIDQFVRAILEPSDDAPFLTDVARFVARIAPVGVANALSRVVLHLTSPGTPDIYQGDELWDFTLVDPDNRDAVDYARRIRALGELESSINLVIAQDDRLKLLITSRLLDLRRSNPDLFRQGDYQPLIAEGPASQHVVAFARYHAGKRLVVVAARLTSGLIGRAPADFWRGTRLPIPTEAGGNSRLHAVFDERALERAQSLDLADLLRTIPVAVLHD